MTLLLTDDQPGLQLFLEGAWVDVPPVPDCLILNVGDLLERWTNGQFKATLHRVVNCGRERFSTAFFLGGCNWEGKPALFTSRVSMHAASLRHHPNPGWLP